MFALALGRHWYPRRMYKELRGLTRSRTTVRCRTRSRSSGRSGPSSLTLQLWDKIRDILCGVPIRMHEVHERMAALVVLIHTQVLG